MKKSPLSSAFLQSDKRGFYCNYSVSSSFLILKINLKNPDKSFGLLITTIFILNTSAEKIYTVLYSFFQFWFISFEKITRRIPFSSEITPDFPVTILLIPKGKLFFKTAFFKGYLKPVAVMPLHSSV